MKDSIKFGLKCGCGALLLFIAVYLILAFIQWDINHYCFTTLVSKELNCHFRNGFFRFGIIVTLIVFVIGTFTAYRNK